MPSISTLADFLQWAATGVGAGAIAFALMEILPFLKGWSSEARRYASLLLTALVALLAWGISILLGYVPAPGTPEAWIEMLFVLLYSCLMTSQALHGRMFLREPKDAEAPDSKVAT